MKENKTEKNRLTYSSNVSAMEKTVGERYEAIIPDTLDLAELACLGINHFTMSISEKDDYEMYWGVYTWVLGGDMLEIISHVGKAKYGGKRKLGVLFGECNPPYRIEEKLVG